MKVTRALMSMLVCGAALAWKAAYAEQDPFRDASVVDAIGIARLADEAGDASLKAALEDPRRERSLMAVRASPAAAAPEALVAPLLPLACGRDPELAPEAAAALLAIGERLTPSELAAREVLLADLRASHEAVERALDAAVALRPDILAALSELNARLTVLEAAFRAP